MHRDVSNVSHIDETNNAVYTTFKTVHIFSRQIEKTKQKIEKQAEYLNF